MGRLAGFVPYILAFIIINLVSVRGMHFIRVEGPENRYISGLSFHEVFEQLLLEGYSEVRRELVRLIAGHSGAVFWECAPVTVKSMATKKFEFVLLPAPGLESFAASADYRSFKSQFTSDSVFRPAIFSNLGGDAVLVVPQPPSLAQYHNWGHLANFIREAPTAYVDEFFRAVASAMQRRVRERGIQPTWLSTCGTGVPWTHVRLDTVPKYYSYHPFTAVPQ